LCPTGDMVEKEVDKFFNKGLTALDEGNWLRALQFFIKCHELDPAFMPAYHEIADIYHFNGQHDAAVEELKKALMVRPDDVESMFTLGTIYSALGRNVDALRVFKRIELLDPGFGPELHYNLGMAYKELDNPELALEQFNIALEMDPSYFECLEAIGRIHLDAGRLEEALTALLDVIEVDPAHINARHMLGVVYSRQKKWKEAIGQFEAVLSLAPDTDEALRELGMALSMAGDYERAVGTLKKAVEMNPDNLQARIDLGSAFIGIHNFDEALRELEQARLKDPGNPVIKKFISDVRDGALSIEGKGKD